MANCVKCGRKLPAFNFSKVCQWCRQYEAAQAGTDGGPTAESDVQPVMPKPWTHSISAPIVTHAIFGINVAVFLAMTLAGASPMRPSSADLLRFGANFGPRTISGEWWRLLSSMFVHIGIIHIALNMWCLWNLGALAERVYGRVTYAAVYLTTGLAASLASVAWHPATISAGASGAIFGITGALIASFKLGTFSLPDSVIQPIYRSVLAFAGYNLFFGMISGITDNAAHIGGLVCGLILGAVLARVAPHSEHRARRVVLFAVVGLTLLGGANLLARSRAYLIHTARAQQFLGKSNVDGAMAELKTAVRQRPTYAYARMLLGETYAQKQQWTDAEEQLKTAVQLEPDNRNYRHALGSLYLAVNRAGDAVTQFSAMAQRHPNDGTAHALLGIGLAAENKHEDALAEYKKALALDPSMAGGLYASMGRSYAGLNQNDEAIAAFQKALEAEPDDYDTLIQLARAYQAKGMEQQAQATYQKAQQLAQGR